MIEILFSGKQTCVTLGSKKTGIVIWVRGLNIIKLICKMRQGLYFKLTIIISVKIYLRNVLKTENKIILLEQGKNSV